MVGSEVWVKHLYDLRKKKVGDHPPTDGFVFCATDGKPIKSFRKVWTASLNFVSWPMIRWEGTDHFCSLKHFYATQLLSKDVSPLLLAKQLGSSVEMLERFYGQVVTSLVHKEINRNKVSKTIPKLVRFYWRSKSHPLHSFHSILRSMIFHRLKTWWCLSKKSDNFRT